MAEAPREISVKRSMPSLIGGVFTAVVVFVLWLLLMVNTALYLNYELFHYCCHVKDDRLVRLIPLVNSIRRHHIAHHNQAIMMEKNFNLTYPIADWLFGTSDLVRGLVGHVFNGYDRRHVRRDLQQTPASVDRAEAAGAGL